MPVTPTLNFVADYIPSIPGAHSAPAAAPEACNDEIVAIDRRRLKYCAGTSAGDGHAGLCTPSASAENGTDVREFADHGG